MQGTREIILYLALLPLTAEGVVGHFHRERRGRVAQAVVVVHKIHLVQQAAQVTLLRQIHHRAIMEAMAQLLEREIGDTQVAEVVQAQQAQAELILPPQQAQAVLEQHQRF
jgi:hypothetical protein